MMEGGDPTVSCLKRRATEIVSLQNNPSLEDSLYSAKMLTKFTGALLCRIIKDGHNMELFEQNLKQHLQQQLLKLHLQQLLQQHLQQLLTQAGIREEESRKPRPLSSAKMTEAALFGTMIKTGPKLGMLKTQLCKNWNEIGFCRYGAGCWFAHGTKELVHVNTTAKACWYILRGRDCPFGDRCYFRHALTDEERFMRAAWLSRFN